MAVAAVVTFVDASFEAVSALVARCEVWSEAASSFVAVAFIVTALSPTHLRTFSTRSRKFRLRRRSCRRCAFQLDHRVALLLQLALLGDVLVRRDPTAYSHWGIDDVDDAPVARLMVQANGFPFATLSRMFRQYSSGLP